MRIFRLAVFGLGALLALAACSGSDNVVLTTDQASGPSSDPTTEASGNIVETAVENGSFTTLAAALQATGLDSVLADDSRNFTVFAPTDEAFEALGQETIDGLLADTEALSDILLYHVLADQIVDGATALTLAGNTVEAANGDLLSLSANEDRLFINMSEVTTADVSASNGVIHVIDKVLLPPEDAPAEPGNIVETAIAAGSFNTLAAALQATDLVSVLADENETFTVFAPTDDAFAALGQDTVDALLADPDRLSDILLYHVLAGQNVDSSTAIGLAGSTVTTANGDDIALSLSEGNLLVNMSVVTMPDIAASNGVIHVIDAVLMPPADEPAPEELSSIVDTAIAAGGFETLVAALQATGLDATLGDTSETFTVFAPTDAAFSALGQDTIDALLADTETLRDILLYHVIAGQAVDSATAISLAGSSVTTANGDDVALSLSEGNLLVNTSVVTVTDIAASNGIIHVIDAVLTPPADAPPPAELPSIYDTVIAAGNFRTLVTALQVTGLDGPLAGGHEVYTVFAPTDEAFAALGQDTINGLLEDPDGLKNILLYHVIADQAVDANTAISLAGSKVTMANGDEVRLSISEGNLRVNRSLVTDTDIHASNGIIHVIDAVLVPPAH